MRIAVASGKGGTGKTTVAVSLALALSQAVDTLLVDCDVEEPNAHVFLFLENEETAPVHVMVPEVDAAACTGCGECGKFCEFNAIVSFGAAALTFPELCHGCGGCTISCPADAIKEVKHEVGEVRTAMAGKLAFMEGRLKIGQVMAPPVIRAVKQQIKSARHEVLDCPPGTACPMITAVQGADAVMLVTEPTPFGLHDLKLAVETVRELGIPFAVVVNRMGVGDDRVQRYCKQENIPIALTIPDERRVAEAYSRGEPLTSELPGVAAQMLTLPVWLANNCVTGKEVVQ